MSIRGVSIERFFMLQGAVASVALSHDESRTCDVCKASHGDEDALIRVIDAMDAQS